MRTTRTRKTLAALCASAMVLTAACGGDDDADGDAPSASDAPDTSDQSDEPSDEPTAEPSDEPAEETSDDPADEPTEATDPPADEPADEGDTGEPQVLNYGSSSQPRSLDPRLSATFDPIFLIPVYDSLVKRTTEGEIAPSLAESWTLADDAMSLELSLREGVTFHDGAPFDGEAVKTNIESNQAASNNLTSSLSVIDSVEVIDPLTVTLNFSEPASHMLGVLAGEAGMMISPDALDNDDIETNPVGTGPFTVSQYDQSSLVYQKWPDYWDADRISLDEINMTFLLDEEARLRALIAGQVDAAPIRSNQKAELASSAPDVELATGSAAFIYGLMLNTSRSELSNPAMRRAMIHAIDRQAINEAFFDGDCEPLVQPYPATYWAHTDGLEDSDVGRYDPDLARSLIQDAGLDGVELQMYVGQAAVFQSVAEVVQAQLGEIGIDVSIEILENTTLVQARRDGEFESSIASVQSGRPDPVQFVADFYTPDGVFNHGNTQFEGVAEPLATLRGTDDQTQREEAIQEIVTTVLEQGPNLIPICSALVLYAHQPSVNGLEIPINYDYDLTMVSIES